MKIYGNLVTGCHDCFFNGGEERSGDSFCSLMNQFVTKNYFNRTIHFDCPMLQEETHSITIMLSDQYNKSNEKV